MSPSHPITTFKTRLRMREAINPDGRRVEVSVLHSLIDGLSRILFKVFFKINFIYVHSFKFVRKIRPNVEDSAKRTMHGENCLSSTFFPSKRLKTKKRKREKNRFSLPSFSAPALRNLLRGKTFFPNTKTTNPSIIRTRWG